MKIYVNTPNGRKYHGYIEDHVFTRNIEPSAIRNSDRSFCINVDACQYFDIHDVVLVKFALRDGESLFVYQISIDALKKIKPVRNEYGELNIRVPIKDCECISSYVPPLEIEAEEEEDKDKQLSLLG